MYSLDKLSPDILKEWEFTTSTILIVIENDMKIIDYNKKFEEYALKFGYLDQLITYTHKSKFIQNLEKCIKEKKTISFSTNFSFDSLDVEDIPFSYKMVLEYIEENNIVVIAEPISPLSHVDAKSYFSMINEYSSLSRRLQKANYQINKKNDELQKLLVELEYRANYDYLTKLFNRRRIIEELNKEYSKYKRFNQSFSLVMLDIDDFKKVNDTYGHQNGDVVLSKIASELKSMLREIDTIGRFGGEEFLILLPSTKYSFALTFCQRILENIAKKKIVLLDNKEISITLSAGLGEIQENIDIDNLISKVDEQLYKAKNNGKNQVL